MRLCRAPHNRKNFLFVGTNEAGENLAGLYSLIATCGAIGVSPIEYLADVLIRVQTQSSSRIDDCFPRTGSHRDPSHRPEAGRRRFWTAGEKFAS